jgi:hypothetical protein
MAGQVRCSRNSWTSANDAAICFCADMACDRERGGVFIECSRLFCWYYMERASVILGRIGPSRVWVWTIGGCWSMPTVYAR